MLAAFRVLVTGSAPRLFSARPRHVRTSASLAHTAVQMGCWRNSVSHATQQNPKGAAAGPIHQLRYLVPYPHAPQPSARGDRDALGQADIPIAFPGCLRLFIPAGGP